MRGSLCVAWRVWICLLDDSLKNRLEFRARLPRRERKVGRSGCVSRGRGCLGDSVSGLSALLGGLPLIRSNESCTCPATTTLCHSAAATPQHVIFRAASHKAKAKNARPTMPSLLEGLAGEGSGLPLTLLVPLVLLASLLLFLRPRKAGRKDAPPLITSSPVSSVPLLGPAIEFGKSPVKMVRRCYDDYGPVFTVPVRFTDVVVDGCSAGCVRGAHCYWPSWCAASSLLVAFRVFCLQASNCIGRANHNIALLVLCAGRAYAVELRPMHTYADIHT